GAIALRQARIPPGRRGAKRRRPARIRDKYRWNNLSSERDLQDGQRSARSRGRETARAWSRVVARGRREHHAEARIRQHERSGDHDRREGRRRDPGCEVKIMITSTGEEEVQCPAATPISR